MSDVMGGVMNEYDGTKGNGYQPLPPAGKQNPACTGRCIKQDQWFQELQQAVNELPYTESLTVMTIDKEKYDLLVQKLAQFVESGL